jgi:CubicO group peptidase (beta-lactamase class C family)
MATGEDLEGLVAAKAAKNARRHPGLVVGAVDTGRSEKAVTAVGHIRIPAGPAPTDKTTWEIGSITKVFTGLLLAISVGRGEVALGTPVRELLPAGTRLPTRDGVEITLEHLTTHRSGLPRSPSAYRPRCGPFCSNAAILTPTSPTSGCSSFWIERSYAGRLARVASPIPTSASGSWGWH